MHILYTYAVYTDAEKREKVVNKIAERLGDIQYWIDYANKLSQS